MEEYEKTGLTINLNKTKYMCTGGKCEDGYWKWGKVEKYGNETNRN